MTGWRPSASVDTVRTRAAMMHRIRAHFETSGLLEVDTPALSSYAASDTQIESLEIGSSSVSRQPMFLHTSPEFCMKRLLSAGFPDIYSICRVFRDGESGQYHQPEFTMIEWYRLGFGLQTIIDDTLGLINAALTTDVLAESPDHYEYRDIFLSAANVDPFTATVDELAHAAGADPGLRDSMGDERNDWLDLILAVRITPVLETDRLTVLRHYPAEQAALARLCPDDPSVADRFEVFFGAIELANGYVELSDSEEQARRMNADDDNRRRRNRPVRPHDRRLLAALENGLPESAGVAIGFERLQMIENGTDDIRAVITFPFEAGE